MSKKDMILKMLADSPNLNTERHFKVAYAKNKDFISKLYEEYSSETDEKKKRGLRSMLVGY